MLDCESMSRYNLFMEDLTGLGKALDSEVAKRSYDDAVSPGAKELGQATADILKGLRLFTAPFQMMGSWQDRLTARLDRVRQSVPEERQVECPANIAGPAIEALRFEEDDSICGRMFEELLAKAIDKETQGIIHPAFPKIIASMSPEEAHALVAYARHSINESLFYRIPVTVKTNNVTDLLFVRFDYLSIPDTRIGSKENKDEPKASLPELGVTDAYNNEMFVSSRRLKSSGLLDLRDMGRIEITNYISTHLIWKNEVREVRKTPPFTDIFFTATLTEFGDRFIETCLMGISREGNVFQPFADDGLISQAFESSIFMPQGQNED